MLRTQNKRIYDLWYPCVVLCSAVLFTLHYLIKSWLTCHCHWKEGETVLFLYSLCIMHFPSEAYVQALISSTSSLQQSFFSTSVAAFPLEDVLLWNEKEYLCHYTTYRWKQIMPHTAPPWITDWKMSVHTFYLSALNQFSEAVEMWYFNLLDSLDSSWYSASVCVHSASVAQNFH